MADRWSRPVQVDGQEISTPTQAHEFLLQAWSQISTADSQIAERAIIAAITGYAPVDEARAKFEAALQVARLN